MLVLNFNFRRLSEFADGLLVYDVVAGFSNFRVLRLEDEYFIWYLGQKEGANVFELVSALRLLMKWFTSSGRWCIMWQNKDWCVFNFYHWCVFNFGTGVFSISTNLRISINLLLYFPLYFRVCGIFVCVVFSMCVRLKKKCFPEKNGSLYLE